MNEGIGDFFGLSLCIVRTPSSSCEEAQTAFERYKMKFTIRAGKPEDCKDIERMIMVSNSEFLTCIFSVDTVG